jgi:hypothetical protein
VTAVAAGLPGSVSRDAFSDTFKSPGERGMGFPIAKVPLGDEKMPGTY